MIARKYKRIITIIILVLILAISSMVFLLNLSDKARSKILNTIPALHYAHKLTKVFDVFYVPLAHKQTDIENWELVIDEKELEKFKENIPENWKAEDLDKDYKKEVRANLYINGKKYKVKIRYKGGGTAHWAWDKKSWRINFDKDEPYNGMDKIKLIVPEDRGYVIEAFNNYRAKKLGLVSLYYDYINLSINGKDKALYFLVEGWGDDVLARNNKPDTSNLYRGEGGYLYDSLESWKKENSFDLVDSKSMEDLDQLLEIFKSGDSELLRNILDEDNFIAWNVHSILSNSIHQGNIHNATMFFNNSTGKFELIPDDVLMYKFSSVDVLENDLANLYLSNSEIRKKRDEVLLEYLSEENIEDDLKYFDELYEKMRYDLYADGLKRYGNILFDIEVMKYKRIIKSNARKIRGVLGKESRELEESVVSEAEINQDMFKYFKNISDIDLFIEQNPMFVVDKEKKEIVLPTGWHNFNKTVVVPKGFILKISAPSTLSFAPDASFVSYSTVIAQGSMENPIHFKGQNGSWGVFAVLGEDQESIFQYCNFSGGGDEYINGVLFTGMLSVHYSDVVIENSEFSNAKGDDGLNVKGGKAIIENNKFVNNSFDAIDLDWGSNSVIKNNLFTSNGNDSIDIGGGKNIFVSGNVVKDSGDKCVSIGERTEDITVFNNLLSGCITGIAVKDASEARIVNNTIANNQTGVALYEKKPVFGGSSALLYNSIVWGSKDSITLDKKSNIRVEYSDIEGGYEGEGNIELEPEWNSEFVLMNKNSSLLEGGKRGYVKELGVEVSKVPMGTIKE